MFVRFRKLFWLIFGKAFNIINAPMYMKFYTNFLRTCGVNINGNPAYISSDAYFDSHDYSKISIGNHTTISREVLLLTHDYSIARGIEALDLRKNGGGMTFLKKAHHIF